MTDPKVIYLQPECCADPEVGRLWCEDDAPEDCEDGKPWTKYVLAARAAPVQPRRQPTMCGYCTYEEADGQLIEQCAKCKAKDAARAAPAQPERDEYGKVGTASWLANKRAQEDIDRAAPARKERS
jgi:hypothetical protein